MTKYKKRVVDDLLTQRLRNKGAILIEGAKWCGKTTTAEQQAGSVLYMAAPDSREQNLNLAEIRPSLLLRGAEPRLLDEWQIAPKLWDAVRYEVDHRDGYGHFLLTGSAVPPRLDLITHTGTGRFAFLRMRPMSLYESGESTGDVSLGELFARPQSEVVGESTLDLEQICYLICRGGWPEASNLSGDDALEQAYDYYEAVVRADISRVDGVKRDEYKVRSIMRTYARNQGMQTSYSVLKADIEANRGDSISRETLQSYTDALRHIFVIEDAEAWNPNLRSRTAIRTTDTHYFVDPSIATAALGIGPNDLVQDLKTCGLLFETMCMRDLRVFAEALHGKVYHYRDKSGLECDAVVHLRNGSYGLIEIKLGGAKQIAEATQTLKRLAALIDTEKMKAPSFLLVLTAVGQYAYRQLDGVCVVPLGCLGM